MRFIGIEVYHNTNDTLSKERMSEELGLELEHSVEDFEIRKVYLDMGKVSFFGERDFYGTKCLALETDVATLYSPMDVYEFIEKLNLMVV